MIISFFMIVFTLFAMSSIGQESITIHVAKKNKKIICEVGTRVFNYSECTNYFSNTTNYDEKETLVFLWVNSDVSARYIEGLLVCLKNSGFKYVRWGCPRDESQDRQNCSHEWDVLHLWFLTPGNLCSTPVITNFKNNDLGLLKFNPWEKSYVPNSIEDAVLTLKNKLTKEKKEQLIAMTEEQLRFENSNHLGKWMQTNWVLWADNNRLRLVFYVEKKITNHTEMSWIILNLLQQDLKGYIVDYSKDFTPLAKSSEGAIIDSKK